MNLPVVQYPEAILRTRSQELTDIERTSPEIARFTDDLLETVMHAKGAAISAVQVGVPKRLVVLHPDLAEDFPSVLVNPYALTFSMGEHKVLEGCLSMRGISVIVTRPVGVHVRATGLDGQSIDIHAKGDLAQALMHELEHLDGVLLVDNVGPVKREMINRRMRGREGNVVRYGG